MNQEEQDAKMRSWLIQDNPDNPPSETENKMKSWMQIGKQQNPQIAEKTQPPVSPIKSPMEYAGNVVQSIRNQFESPIKNIPESTFKYVKDVSTPLMHPVKTYETFKELGFKGTVKAVRDTYANRYGTVEKAMETLDKDPVGMMSDLFFILNGAKAITQTSGRLVSRTLPKTTPERLYESGAKFGTSLGKKERSALTKTALEHRLMPTPTGVDKLTAKLYEVNQKVDSLVAQAEATGQKIHSSIIFKYIDDLKKQFSGVKPGVRKNLKQVADAVDDIKFEIKRSGSPYLSPTQLQSLKRELYKQTKYDSTPFAPQRGTEAANKVMAKAAKEGVERFAPETKDLNQTWSELINLIKPLEKSSARISNTNLISLHTPLNIGFGGYLGGPAGAVAGIALSILESPRLKTGAAILLYNAQRKPLFATKAAAAALAAGEHQIGEQVNQEQ